MSVWSDVLSRYTQPPSLVKSAAHPYPGMGPDDSVCLLLRILDTEEVDIGFTTGNPHKAVLDYLQQYKPSALIDRLEQEWYPYTVR